MPANLPSAFLTNRPSACRLWANSKPQGANTGMSLNMLRAAGTALDYVLVMSYDAGDKTTTGYDPVVRQLRCAMPGVWFYRHWMTVCHAWGAVQNRQWMRPGGGRWAALGSADRQRKSCWHGRGVIGGSVAVHCCLVVVCGTSEGR